MGGILGTRPCNLDVPVAPEAKDLANILPRYTALESLDLTRNRFNGAAMEELMNGLHACENLQELDFSCNTNMGAPGVAALARRIPPKLQRLNLFRCGLDGAAMKEMRNAWVAAGKNARDLHMDEPTRCCALQ